MDFYDRIKTLVKAKKWSLVEFVQSLGISYNRYKAQNLIRTPLRLDECAKIARALGVSLEYLATGEAGEELTLDERELLEHYRKASADGKRSILASAAALANAFPAVDSEYDTMLKKNA